MRVARSPPCAAGSPQGQLIRAYFQIVGGVPWRFFGEQPRDEEVVYTANHQSNADWFVADVMAAEVPRWHSIGRVGYVLKDTLVALPLYGPYFWMRGSHFVGRGSGSSPQLSAGGDADGGAPPRWTVIFPEGTRFMPRRTDLLRDSKAAAVAHGYPAASFERVLFPRTRGFVALVQSLRRTGRGDRVAVYDVTTAYVSEDRRRAADTSMESMVVGAFREIRVHVARYALSQLPEDEAELKRWLEGRFAEKDDIMLELLAGGGPRIGTGRAAASEPAVPLAHALCVASPLPPLLLRPSLTRPAAAGMHCWWRASRRAQGAAPTPALQHCGGWRCRWSVRCGWGSRGGAKPNRVPSSRADASPWCRGSS